MREKDSEWSSKTFRSTADSMAGRKESVTHEGEQRAREGRGLDPLVDPKSHGGWRESLSLLVPRDDGTYELKYGVAMPVKNGLDTTGSMGGNVEKAFHSLPRTQELLALNADAVLRNGTYHVQQATAALQDVVDNFPYQITEFEPDNEIEAQMRKLVPEAWGGDEEEDYELDLYATGFRTRLSIVQYGLKGYDFIIADSIGRGKIFPSLVKKYFGGNEIPQASITKEELGRKVLESWHGFFLQVRDSSQVTRWWTEVFGQERVIILPRTELVAEVQAAIIGLTEGVLDLQNITDWLKDVAKLNDSDARQIVRAVNHIPLRAQAELANYGNLPKPGSIFASREDIWPIDVAKLAGTGIGGEGVNWEEQL